MGGFRGGLEGGGGFGETSETPLTLTQAVVKEIGRSVNFFAVSVDQAQRRVGLGVVSISDRGVSS